MLADMLEVLGDRQSRRGAGAYEKIRRGVARVSVSELIGALADKKLRGEIVVMAGPPLEESGGMRSKLLLP